MALGARPDNAVRTASLVSDIGTIIQSSCLSSSSPGLGPFDSSTVQRSIITGIYVATELHMLSDESAGFEESWRFLRERVGDVESLLCPDGRAEKVFKIGEKGTKDVENGGSREDDVYVVARAMAGAAVSLAGPVIGRAVGEVMGGIGLGAGGGSGSSSGSGDEVVGGERMRRMRRMRTGAEQRRKGDFYSGVDKGEAIREYVSGGAVK